MVNDRCESITAAGELAKNGHWHNRTSRYIIPKRTISELFMRVFILATLLFATLVSPGNADGAQTIDYERHRNCLVTNPSDPTACFFHVSRACQLEEEERAPNPLRGRMWCDLREYEVWQNSSEEALEILKVEMPAEVFGALTEQQAKWSESHSVACIFPYEFLRGTWVSSEAARCLLEDYQVRGATLLGFLQLLEAEDFVFQSRN